jgi:predicted esterase
MEKTEQKPIVTETVAAPKGRKAVKPPVQMATPDEALRMKEIEDLMAQDKITEAWDRYENLFQESQKSAGATRPWLHDLGNRVQQSIFDGYSRGIDVQKPKSLMEKK